MNVNFSSRYASTSNKGSEDADFTTLASFPKKCELEHWLIGFALRVG